MRARRGSHRNRISLLFLGFYGRLLVFFSPSFVFFCCLNPAIKRRATSQNPTGREDGKEAKISDSLSRGFGAGSTQSTRFIMRPLVYSYSRASCKASNETKTRSSIRSLVRGGGIKTSIHKCRHRAATATWDGKSVDWGTAHGAF